MCTERGCPYPAENGLCTWHTNMFADGRNLLGSTLPKPLLSKQEAYAASAESRRLGKRIKATLDLSKMGIRIMKGGCPSAAQHEGKVCVQ